MRVQKRDGRVEDWNGSKIVSAISKAATEAGEEIKEFCVLLSKIEAKAQGKETILVSEVHKMVEDVLMGSRYKKTARAYIEKRSERDRERLLKSGIIADVAGLVEQSNEDILNQNANKPSRILATHRDLLAGILSQHWLKAVLPQHLVDAHEKGVVYWHDSDYAVSKGLHNCGVYDYAGMLETGFNLGTARIETPRSIGVATTVLSQIASTISGSSYGGQSIHRYTELLKPYAEASLEKLRKEQEEFSLPEEWVWRKLRKEIYDAHQTMIYQLNTICGSNGQSAFLSLSIYPSEDPLVKMIAEEYFKAHMRGLGKDGRTSCFPKVIYFLEEGKNLNEGDPNYDEFLLACQCAVKREYPDFVYAKNNRRMTGFSDVVTPMGCRSFVPKYIENGKEKYVGRFNCGVVTVSLPYVAAEAKGDKEEFFDLLDKYCEIAYEMHMIRINGMKETKAKQNPILWMEGALARLDPEQTIGHLFYNGNATASLGYIGVADVQEICGDQSKQFALQIVKFLKDKTNEWYKRSNIYFSPYGSPMELGCYKLATALKKAFPELNFSRDYLTNSFHTHVFSDYNVFEKFEAESDFYMYSSGGNVNNVELPNMKHNIEGLVSVIHAAKDKVNYLIVNQPVDQCFKCGFEGEFSATDEGFTCPVCGNRDEESVSVIRRVSGFIFSPGPRPANRGKMQEILQRKKHV